MLTALIVAYHFPPIGGVGVQRSLKLARYLPEFGVHPVILTGPGHYDNRWTPADPTMLEEVGDVQVFRADGPIPASGSGLEGRIERMLGRQGKFVRWWIDSIPRFGLEPGRSADVILGELGPYETAFGVEKLSRLIGVPWVADLQDPWALDEMWLYPTAIHRIADRARMRSTLRSAAAVVMNTPEAELRLRAAFSEFRDRRVVSISNGFDRQDFATAPPVRDDRIFRIVHAGYLHTDLGVRHRKTRRLRRLLGGMPVPAVDFLTRSHVFLLDAVAMVLRNEPGLEGTIEIDLIGAETAEDREAAAPFPFVRFHGHRSHGETIELLQTADLLFLPMQDLPEGVRAGLVPSKTYEYMASGTPILAAVPDGDARDALLAVGTAIVCRPAAVDCLADAIQQRICEWRRGARQPQPNPGVLAQFEYRGLTEKLAALLGEVVSK